MYRKLKDYLLKWRDSPIRTPLIVRGARQVGKTHTIREFGHAYFEQYLELNLETQPNLLSAFASREAKEICSQLSALSRQEIVPTKTLLFIDEIQCSQDAMIALRSFKEEMPELHVITAGSLLEFALQDDETISFPVGRVTFAYMQPMSFREFLLAMKEHLIAEQMGKAHLEKPLSQALHDRLLVLVRTYFMTGGMPEVVEAFRTAQNFIDAGRIQNRLMTAFIADFAKYGRRYDYRKLQQLLNAAPRLVGKQFKYSHVDPHVKARDFKLPLLDLERSGLLRLIRATSANGLPLGAQEREGIFKIQFLDIGLMQNSLGVEWFNQSIEESLFVHEGALAEQFVGQEFMANMDPELRPELFYWSREEPQATAEVDFVINYKGEVIPIEVKAGATGRLRSLRQFMKDKKRILGVRISQQPLTLYDGILSVPFYMCSELPRLIKESFDKIKG